MGDIGSGIRKGSTSVLLLLAILFLPLSGLAQVQTQTVPRPWNSRNGAGFANSAGVYVIPPKFTHTYGFNADGIALVEVEGKKGYIDLKGDFVVPPLYDEIHPFNKKGLTLVRIGDFGAGQPWPKYGFVDASGHVAIPVALHGAYAFSPNGLCFVVKHGDSPYSFIGNKYGYMNTKGEYVIPPKFDDAKSFGINDRAAVKVGDKWGIIDAKGNFVVPPKYDEVPVSPESIFDTYGLAAVRKGRFWGYINSQGDPIGPRNLYKAGGFDENGLAKVIVEGVLRTYKEGVINSKGEYVFKPQFDRILPYLNGYAQVALKGRWGFIDTRGKIVIRPQFKFMAKDFNKHGLTQTGASERPSDRKGVGYMNAKGDWIARPGQYDFVSEFDDLGFALVRLGGKFGYINTAGEVVIKWFEVANPFAKNGLASVKIRGKYGYVDRAGAVVIRPQFEDTYRFAENGLSVAKQGGKWGYINVKGEFVIPPRFDLASTFEYDNIAVVVLEGKKGYIDTAGKFLELPQ
jgi:hypothetical protein